MKALGLLLTFLLLGAWAALAFDVDDRLMSEASNDKLIAIVYTPHVSPGGSVKLRLTLRTGTKSRLTLVRASVDGTMFLVREPGGHYGSSASFGGDYEQFVEVKIPKEQQPTDRLLVTFDVAFEPPRKNPMSPHTAIDVPLRIRTADGARLGRIASGAWAGLSLIAAIAIAVFAGRQLRRRFALTNDKEEDELAIWAVCVGIGMHGVLGSWLFAMPVSAATGRIDTWLFIVLIGGWVIFSVLVGWIAAKRTAPGEATQDIFSRLEIREIAEPDRRCKLAELTQKLKDADREWRVIEKQDSLRIEHGKQRVWLEYRSPDLRLSELRFAEENGVSLLLEVAHVASRCLGAFILCQASTVARIDPTMTISDIRMAWMKSRMVQLEAMGSVLEEMQRAMERNDR